MTKNSRIYESKHFLFDFDGTLVDSMPYWAKAMLTVLDNHHISYGSDIIRIITPLGLQKTAAYFQSLGYNGTVEQAKAEIFAELTPMYENVITLKNGVADCLTALKNAGRGLHVLTASPHCWLDVCLKRCGVYDLFDNVWSCEDFPTTKTDPAIYRQAANRIGVSIGDIAFLDDNINADFAAKQSGIGVIGVYDDTGKADREAMTAFTDGYIENFSELYRNCIR